MPKKSVRSKPPAKRAIRRGKQSAARPKAKSALRKRARGAAGKSAKRASSKPAKRVQVRPAKRVPSKPAKRVQAKPAKRVPIQPAQDEPRTAAQSTAAVRRRTAKILLAALAQHADETRARFGALIRSGGETVSNRIESTPQGAGETLEQARAKLKAAPKRAVRKK